MRVTVPVNGVTGLTKGFAFVEFEQEEQMKSAIDHMNNVRTLHLRPLFMLITLVCMCAL